MPQEVDPRLRQRADRLPRPDRGGPSRCRDGLGFSILDRVTGRAERLLPDEDADRRGGRLQPRCHGHDVAHDYRLPVHLDPAERDVGLTRCDGQRNLAAVLVEPVTDGECCADSPFGVVLVGRRNAEQCHGGVAGERLNGSTEAFEVRADARVVGAEDSANVLGVELLVTRREVGEVGQQDGDSSPRAA